MCNVYSTEIIAAVRLDELRAAAARAALIESAEVGGRGLGAAVGSALIRVGQWLTREAAVGPNAGVRVAR